MFGFIVKKIFGSQNERELKKMQPLVDQINALEPEIQKLSDEQLRSKTDEFRKKLSNGVSIDDVLIEAFAVVREAGIRVLNMRHYDVQLVGGIVLHKGKIAEMITGEGKTLVATLPVYLNGITGKGVHVVTVNDYLAKRDSEWMGPLYEFLGLSVGVIQHDMDQKDRYDAYRCDITYGTNNEFGFDYLRDNMVVHKEDMVQPQHHFAIVDEVDSILIDEARTPLIISGASDQSTDLYYKVNQIIPKLEVGERNEDTKEETGDYIIDEKSKSVSLTESGEHKIASLLGIPNIHDLNAIEYRHHVIQAILAHNLYKKDVDYMVKDGEILIVDEFTGRLMPGRRWSDGLHQAIEAKEKVEIKRENQTLATITFQNYFRMYDKLGGMTGTALTEADEFLHIYKLDVVAIPTNRELLRKSEEDVIYRTEREKFNAVVDEIIEKHKEGRPVLVGTISIAKSEYLGNLLKKRGIPHSVLNAKYHENEAFIVAQAGRYKAVTIATNMAGRGTDIVLGGNAEYLTRDFFRKKNIRHDQVDQEEWTKILNRVKEDVDKEQKLVIEAGGLHVIGSERHESRRVDNQLRGRCGRQGDPGSSRFFISLQDDLMRIFGSDRISSVMERLGMEEGQEIQNPFVSRAIESAQRRVEGRNFEIRKQLLDYDNVMNKQREIIYAERKRILEGKELKKLFYEMLEDALYDVLEMFGGQGFSDGEWDKDGFKQWVHGKSHLDLDDSVLDSAHDINDVVDEVMPLLNKAYEQKEKETDPTVMRHLEKVIMLQIFDTKWKDHLYAMDHLREGIHLRAYAQRDPKVEYTNEGFAMFTEMFKSIKQEIVEVLFRVQAKPVDHERSVFSDVPQDFVHQEMDQFGAGESIGQGQGQGEVQKPVKRTDAKVGRNDPCPCGSGKKYKKCCLREPGKE